MITQFHGDGIQIYTFLYVALKPEMAFGSNSGYPSAKKKSLD